MAPPQHRRCLSCHRLAPRAEFLRVVREPGGNVRIGGGMGRSAYLCPTLACWQIAQKKNRLGRSLRVAVAPEILEQLKALIDRAED